MKVAKSIKVEVAAAKLSSNDDSSSDDHSHILIHSDCHYTHNNS